MADTRISNLTAGTPDSNDVLPYTNGTTTLKSAFSDARDGLLNPTAKGVLFGASGAGTATEIGTATTDGMALVYASAESAGIKWGADSLQSGYLYGLTLSNSSGDATNDIVIAAGNCTDSTDAENMVLSGTITKQLDAAWAVGTDAGGLDTGSIDDVTYHVFLIKRSDTGVVDALFSASPTAPTMPADYDYKRRIGSIIRASSAILAFIQTDDKFAFNVPAADVNATNNYGASAVTETLTVPIGIRIEAYGDHSFNTNTNVGGVITDLSNSDIDPVTASNQTVFTSSGAAVAHAYWRAFTNTSGQVRFRASATGAAIYIYISTFGWFDTRGK